MFDTLENMIKHYSFKHNILTRKRTESLVCKLLSSAEEGAIISSLIFYPRKVSEGLRDVYFINNDNKKFFASSACSAAGLAADPGVVNSSHNPAT